MEDYDIKLFARGRKYNEDTFRKFILHLRESLIRYNYLDEVREDEWTVMFYKISKVEEQENKKASGFKTQ